MNHRQIHLGAHFPGVNNTTVWTDPESGSHIDFDSFRHLAATAERGLFDFFFLAEGLRLREHRGRIHDLDVVGRPDTIPVLAALAAVTTHLGLVGTINATFNEPYDLARQFATLDAVSMGRAGWNVVTTSDAFTGANFRRGGYLPREQRYEHAAEVLDIARLLWNSWPADEPLASAGDGAYLGNAGTGRFSYHGTHHRVAGRFTVPRTPQGEPVLFQAGDSEQGRDFAARYADAVFTIGRPLEEARTFYSEVKGRLAALGREPGDLKILPGSTFVLADTDDDAYELAARIRRQQVSGPTAIRLLELLWNRDLSAYDPDGPLPEVDPDVGETTVVQGQTRHFRDPVATARQWRQSAAERGLSIREFMIEQSSRQNFIGSPTTIAGQMIDYVDAHASDGFILVPHITPGGLDRFVDEVIPLLQERGAYRSRYVGSTLRHHLGLPEAGIRRPDPAEEPLGEEPT